MRNPSPPLLDFLWPRVPLGRKSTFGRRNRRGRDRRGRAKRTAGMSEPQAKRIRVEETIPPPEIEVAPPATKCWCRCRRRRSSPVRGPALRRRTLGSCVGASWRSTWDGCAGRNQVARLHCQTGRGVRHLAIQGKAPIAYAALSNEPGVPGPLAAAPTIDCSGRRDALSSHLSKHNSRNRS